MHKKLNKKLHEINGTQQFLGKITAATATKVIIRTRKTHVARIPPNTRLTS